MIRDKSSHHEKIIAAAWDEFLTYGFADASMRRIAAAAGMSAAGLYKHFPSKEDMFAALVEPACQGLMALYRQEETLETESLQRGEITQKWESGGEAKIALSYIYDHLDAFRLLICKSAGTRYETFLHDLAVEEEKTTIAMMNMLKAQGKQINNIRPEEFHLLVTINVNAVFQAVEHGFRPCITPILWTPFSLKPGRLFSATEPSHDRNIRAFFCAVMLAKTNFRRSIIPWTNRHPDAAGVPWAGSSDSRVSVKEATSPV